MMRKFLFFMMLMVAAWQVCTAETITITYNEGQAATVGGDQVEDVKIAVKGSRVSIKDLRDYEKNLNTLTYVLKGKTSDGQLKLNTYVKARILLDGLDLTCQEGAPIHLKNKKMVTMECAQGSRNRIVIAACSDTAKNKQAAIWAKDKLTLKGKGTLQVEAMGNGCKGINCKDDLQIDELTLSVVTKGDNLGVDTTKMMGPPPGGGNFPPGGFNPDDIPEDVKKKFEEMRKKFEGQSGMMGGGMFPPRDSVQGMPGMPPMGGMPGGKQKYISTCKGIKSAGTVTIGSGMVSVETNSNGAEGIEGKKGVTINGGNVTVNATDDGINSGGKIVFADGNTTVISITNDAVDSNFGGMMPPFGKDGFTEPGDNGFMEQGKEKEPAIIVSGGTVMAWSKRGAPEEGLDCDFAPIEVSGGTLFTIGAGMGEMPSVPTEETAKQATALFIGVNFSKGEQVKVTDKAGKTLIDFKAPFDFQRSSSLVSCPAFKVGNSYSLTSGKETKNFELNKQFTTVR